VTTPAPVTTPAATTAAPSTESPAPGKCTFDENCKGGFCGADGMCTRCTGKAYLMDGSCHADVAACEDAGLIAVGDGKHGRACVAAGGACVEPSCNIPSSLGPCDAAVINSADSMTCTQCEANTWAIGGGCEKQLTVHKGKVVHKNVGWEGTDMSCGEDCRDCVVRQSMPTLKESDRTFRAVEVFEIGGAVLASTHYAACNTCKNHKLLLDHQCISNFECPAENTQYNKYQHGGTCEAPFTCESGRKVQGDNEGRRCKCMTGTCVNCHWGTGGHACVVCKKSKFLLNGECLSEEQCLGQGRYVPIRGDGPRGGVCVKLSTP